ncbi:MAG TPA: 2-oxoacid:ferredoxin oxidoreductase subunit beta, partial [Anaerolineae bacterium]|nr:2-oxoacid:ferredoxin oxidoreductase subunit beta [Anaerolineae bacterium]
CPGCGDYAVFNAFLKMLVDLRLPPEKVAVASGIGCSGRFPAFVRAYGFHGVHGRALPLATGIKLANPELTVFAVGGDGDAFSIGGGHFPHAARRNVDITYIVMDNSIYGLTKGQPSPTSPVGMRRKASPFGTVETPLNPILMALAYNTSFVARCFSSQVREMEAIFQRATQHRGFSFVQVLSPCVTFNDTYDRYRHITAPVPTDHDIRDRTAAFQLALNEETLYLGVFYERDDSSYEEKLKAREAELRAGNNYLQELVAGFRC